MNTPLRIRTAGDDDDRALRALVEMQQPAGYTLPAAVLEAVVGIRTADEALQRLFVAERETGQHAQDALESRIRAEVEAAIGHGESTADPFGPVRAMAARHASIPDQIRLHDGIWSRWSIALVGTILEGCDEIADAIAGALTETLEAAGPAAAALSGFGFRDPAALQRAPKDVRGLFGQAERLAQRHDALRVAAWGLAWVARPRGGGFGSPVTRDQWLALIYRFRGGGVEVVETLDWHRDDDDRPTIRIANPSAVRHVILGHPVERLMQAVADARDARPARVEAGRVWMNMADQPASAAATV